jgi:hypothetical protein
MGTSGATSQGPAPSRRKASSCPVATSRAPWQAPVPVEGLRIGSFDGAGSAQFRTGRVAPAVAARRAAMAVWAGPRRGGGGQMPMLASPSLSVPVITSGSTLVGSVRAVERVHAPVPRAAHQRRCRAGAVTSPSVMTPWSSSAIRVLHSGSPARKLAVPSIASMIHLRRLWPVAPNSSPRTASLGRSRRIRVRRDAFDLFVSDADGAPVALGAPRGIPSDEVAQRDRVGGVGQAVGEGQVGVDRVHAAVLCRLTLL